MIEKYLCRIALPLCSSQSYSTEHWPKRLLSQTVFWPGSVEAVADAKEARPSRSHKALVYFRVVYALSRFRDLEISSFISYSLQTSPFLPNDILQRKHHEAFLP